MAAKKTSKAKKAAKAPAKAATKLAPAKSVKTKSGKDDTLRLTSLGPSLTVNDVHKSLAWYRDILGFTPGERWEHEGKLLGVEMNAGGVFLMIGQDDWKKGRDRLKGVGVRFYCNTDQDIDRLAAKIKANGGTLAQEPADQPWGTRELSIDDPDGYKITIAKEAKKR
ncbi:MAG TPA: VOC family protein [Thermoanaerobaculia bacterium]|nr:VOC family protein [Thermoanaerobaculia bacterium]